MVPHVLSRSSAWRRMLSLFGLLAVGYTLGASSTAYVQFLRHGSLPETLDFESKYEAARIVLRDLF